MGQNEAGITRLFYDALSKAAEKSGMNFQSFPMGGQDRKVLSDELLATLDNFALVEMKDSDAQLGSEGKKRVRVLRLCEALERDEEMRAVHDACHWIAYKNNRSGRIEASPYRHQICNRKILGECQLQAASPSNEASVTLNILGSRFLGEPPPLGQHTEAFNTYLAWLMKTVTTQEGQSFHVVASVSDAEGEVIVVEFSSLAEINDWLARENPRPSLC